MFVMMELRVGIVQPLRTVRLGFELSPKASMACGWIIRRSLIGAWSIGPTFDIQALQARTIMIIVNDMVRCADSRYVVMCVSKKARARARARA